MLCYVSSGQLYWSEIWTLTSVCESKLNAFEKWHIKNIFKIKWTEKLSIEVFRKVKYEFTSINIGKLRTYTQKK